MNIVYEPTGAAREYADLAANLYGNKDGKYCGCSHGCLYCYAPSAMKGKITREDFAADPHPRIGVVEKLAKDAQKLTGDKRPILLCFLCDPYQPAEKEFKVTTVMQRLNRVIHRSGLTSRFVSLFYGELEASGNFVYVNAGHDPILLLRGDGRTEQLRSTGIVMGPLADAQYRRELVHLDPGDALLLYTDGTVERIDPGGGGEFGLERLEEVTRRALASGRALSELPGQILAELREFGAGTPWADDVTLVIVRRDG